METNPALADPVLDTAVGVGVVAVRLAMAVQIMSTVQTILQLLVAVLVTLVTDGSLITVSVLQEVAAVVDLVEHHGLPLAVIGAEDVVRLGVVVGAVPVVPTVVLVLEDAGPQVTAVHHLVRGETVRVLGGAGAGGTVGRVSAGSVTTVNILG